MVDSDRLRSIVAMDPQLCHRFLGVFSSDTFPEIIKDDHFLILNSAPSNENGEHWLLLAQKDRFLFFYDSFGRDMGSAFPHIYERVRLQGRTTSLMQIFPCSGYEQPMDSIACGLYCVFVAHFIYAISESSFPLFATEDDILQFAATNFNFCMVKYLNNHS